MKILILGGTNFVGRHLVEAARSHGHSMTLFNRGRLPDPFADLPGIERIRGDRNRDLSALAGGRWDAAIDTCGYVPGQVRAAAGLLAERVGHYTFISTLSVYATTTAGAVDESFPVRQVPAEQLAELEALEPAGPNLAVFYGALYGGLKALCEQEATLAMGGRALNVRPGLIVGPHDYTDRFTYWPGRMARGGEVLAPGDPGGPVQLIDVRDLAAWVLGMIERGETGTYNTVGPERGLTMAGFLEECRAAIGADARLTWVSEEHLLAAGIQPWTELPLWLPRARARSPVVNADCRKAMAAGLRFRPLTETIRDTLAWDRTRPPGTRGAGLSPERERELLRTWQAVRPA